MRTARVDVIVPAWNAAGTIEATIASLQKQTMPDFRILVADDGSTDGTADIVARLARGDGRILLFRQENAGIPATLNRLISMTRAELVARSDADDLSEPDRLERQAAFLEANPGIVAVSGAHHEIDGAGRPTGRLHRPGRDFAPDPRRIPAREPPLTQPFVMMRRSAVIAAGGYRPLPVSEDSDLYWRLLRHGRLAVMPEVLGRYRMHAASVSSASIRHGRLMAICSQLSALSARRIADGAGDLRLDHLDRGRLLRCRSLAEAFAIAAADVAGAERTWLAAAVGAKLMELSGYRPFELEASDCDFIRGALADEPDLAREDRRDLDRQLAATAARLLRLGRWPDAARLVSPRLWPQAAARAATGRLYWVKHLPNGAGAGAAPSRAA